MVRSRTSREVTTLSLKRVAIWVKFSPVLSWVKHRVPFSLKFVSTWQNLPSLSKNFFLPFGPQFGLKMRERVSPPLPRAPPLDSPLMWTGISSPSQCWRGGSVLWTIFIDIKKIIKIIKIKLCLERNNLYLFFIYFKIRDIVNF